LRPIPTCFQISCSSFGDLLGTSPAALSLVFQPTQHSPSFAVAAFFLAAGFDNG
jgi:hypothetical protein